MGGQCVPPCPVGPPPLAHPINSTPVTSYQRVSPSGCDASQRGSSMASCTPVAARNGVPHEDLLGSVFGCTTSGRGEASQQRPLTLTATAAPSSSVPLSPQSRSGDASQ